MDTAVALALYPYVVMLESHRELISNPLISEDKVSKINLS